MPTCFSALLCHAPIVVPAVGRDRAGACARTTAAMRQVAARLVHARPDRVVVVSPHAPRHRTSLGALRGPHRGDLARFGAPGIAVDLPDAPEVAAALGLPPVDTPRLDHGATVPLAFLWEAGWRGPTSVLSLPRQEGPEAAAGRAIAALPGRTAVVASGDLSHRLAPGAPAGFDPDARRFDDAFVRALETDDWAAALDPPCRDRAAEDAVASVAVATAAAGTPLNTEVVAYEAPFGVGYAEAILHEPVPPAWAVARAAVRAAVLGRRIRIPRGGPGPAGVFVTLYRDGSLRGCIGHIAPTEDRLYAEIAAVAPLAALEDPRFPPVRADELDALDLEVSVLEPPEPCTRDDLDPARYGVVVSGRGRRGVLLPGLDGIDTVDRQIAIATRKAGLTPADDVTLARFRVRVEEMPR